MTLNAVVVRQLIEQLQLQRQATYELSNHITDLTHAIQALIEKIGDTERTDPRTRSPRDSAMGVNGQ